MFVQAVKQHFAAPATTGMNLALNLSAISCNSCGSPAGVCLQLTLHTCTDARSSGSPLKQLLHELLYVCSQQAEFHAFTVQLLQQHGKASPPLSHRCCESLLGLTACMLCVYLSQTALSAIQSILADVMFQTCTCCDHYHCSLVQHVFLINGLIPCLVALHRDRAGRYRG